MIDTKPMTKAITPKSNYKLPFSRFSKSDAGDAGGGVPGCEPASRRGAAGGRTRKPLEKPGNHIKLVLQNCTQITKIPSRYYFQRWITLALAGRKKPAEVTIRLVDEPESALLNKTYRHKKGPTNVLSFPFETPVDLKLPFLGDLVICAPLVYKEAKQQQKIALAHWAHLTIHGVLHLLGYDHIKDDEATIMENIEIKLLARLGYENPYEL